MLPDISRLDGLLKEIYIDLAKPGVSQVGKAIGAVIGLGNTALWPLHLLNERARVALEANLERYRRRLESVSQEQVAPVPAEIAVPLLERLSYVSDATLSEMYAGLLARASTVDQRPSVHPSFATILANLTPDEALLLRDLLKSTVHYRIAKTSYRPSGSEGLTLKFNGTDSPLAFPSMVQLYLINLSSLGLVSGVDRALMSATETSSHQIPGDKAFETGAQGGEVNLSKLGILFLDACGAQARPPAPEA